jgi:hypothetical protein
MENRHRKQLCGTALWQLLHCDKGKPLDLLEKLAGGLLKRRCSGIVRLVAMLYCTSKRRQSGKSSLLLKVPIYEKFINYARNQVLSCIRIYQQAFAA